MRIVDGLTRNYREYPFFEVTIPDHLNEDQFKRIQEILGQSPGRFKAWSETFHFEAGQHDLVPLCNYLREQGIIHSVNVQFNWKPRS